MTTKQQRRAALRTVVFTRDRHRCRCCDAVVNELDAHHITPRDLMPNGGYVPDNVIALCESCHIDAEEYLQLLPEAHVKRAILSNFAPAVLYGLIGSSYEAAVIAATKDDQ